MAAMDPKIKEWLDDKELLFRSWAKYTREDGKEVLLKNFDTDNQAVISVHLSNFGADAQVLTAHAFIEGEWERGLPVGVF